MWMIPQVPLPVEHEDFLGVEKGSKQKNLPSLLTYIYYFLIFTQCPSLSQKSHLKPIHDKFVLKNFLRTVHSPIQGEERSNQIWSGGGGYTFR